MPKIHVCSNTQADKIALESELAAAKERCSAAEAASSAGAAEGRASKAELEQLRNELHMARLAFDLMFISHILHGNAFFKINFPAYAVAAF